MEDGRLVVTVGHEWTRTVLDVQAPLEVCSTLRDILLPCTCNASPNSDHGYPLNRIVDHRRTLHASMPPSD